MGKTLSKNVNFATVWTSCFYILERHLFVLEYHKKHFPGLYCLKKKVGKPAIFGPQPWGNPFPKMSIFRLFDRLVFKGYKRVFIGLEYHKRHFLGLYWQKEKLWKMIIIGPN